MKAVKLMIALMFCGCITLAQSGKEDAKEQLDSLRQLVLAPKLRMYEQRLEKFTSLVARSDKKACIKQYAKQIVLVSDAFQDDLETLYDCHYYPSNSGMYVGMGYGWLYPGFGGYSYSYPYDRYVGPGYDCLPQLFYEIDRIKRCANSIRLLSSKHNVDKKLNGIRQEIEILKSLEEAQPGSNPALSMHQGQ